MEVTYDVVAVVGAVLLPTIIFLTTTHFNMKKEHEAKQIKLDAKLIQIDDILSKQDRSLTRAHLRIDQLDTDHKRLETAFEVQLDRVNEKLEKIFDLLVGKN